MLLIVFELFGINSEAEVETTDNLGTPITMDMFNIIIKTFCRSSSFYVEIKRNNVK